MAAGVQQLESTRKRRLRFAGGDDSGDDFQAAQEVDGAVGFGKAGITVSGCQSDLRHVAGGIKDTGSAGRKQLSCDFGAEPTIGQPQIENDQVRLGMPCERDRCIDGTGDAADLVAVVDKQFFHEIRHHEVVFNNQDLEHALPSSLSP